MGIENADITACLGAQHGHRAGMREQLMVRGLERAAEQRETGRVDADRVAEGSVQGRSSRVDQLLTRSPNARTARSV